MNEHENGLRERQKRHRVRTRLIALGATTVAVVALAAGCGGNDENGGTTGTATSPATNAARGGTVEVAMKNIRFQPEKVTVRRGTRIVWVNDDSVAHDVHKVSGPGADFASGPAGGMQPGDKYEIRVTQPGTIKYVCELHKPYMAGEITVK
ncbi:cupredoxin domain-containing protein [Thermoleophilum album]|jgi:plastocyanin|uniref:cupredoxin domain-containing protein n=1 Tax=Thermoleophilum album TaxID=29539 RepID=UPI00237CCC0D|nr:plastocyanin/azurin family copper-binding protein [Thermoleophilum album]WDT93772.1 cupredoxin domain-containing protein [Thermoleophilum album]